MGVGRRLRQAREGRGLSVAEVAARTKIPMRQLTCIEGEDYDQVPGGIFVRGHIRAMARVVGLDPFEVTEHFDEEMRPRPPVIPAQQDEENRGPRLRMAAEPAGPRPNGHLIAAAVIIVLSIVFAIAWFGRARDLPPSSRHDAAPGQPRMAMAAPVPVGSTGTDDPRPVGTTGLSAADGLALSLRAQRVCWLSLTVDGQRVAYRMLQEGDVVSARVHQRASVRTGDAGALLLSVGGRPAKPLGAPGTVRTLEFRPEDVKRLVTR
jgi:cytoskeleton protein RodZ